MPLFIIKFSNSFQNSSHSIWFSDLLWQSTPQAVYCVMKDFFHLFYMNIPLISHALENNIHITQTVRTIQVFSGYTVLMEYKTVSLYLETFFNRKIILLPMGQDQVSFPFKIDLMFTLYSCYTKTPFYELQIDIKLQGLSFSQNMSKIFATKTW